MNWKTQQSFDPAIKVTIYVSGEFFGNIRKVEARLHQVGTRRYAQYEAAPTAIFTPKGARKPRQITQGYAPYMLILRGWDHPDPPSIWDEPKQDGPVTVQRSKHSACSDGWIKDFESALGEVKPEDVVADFRGVDPMDWCKKESA